MHDIEPHYNWRHIYTAEEDSLSPFYGREYSEFLFSDRVYNHFIHPQWDDIGSPTLFLKLLYCNYSEEFAVVELIGEWNDCLNNDIMILKREFVDVLISEGIKKFLLIGENVLNFHYSDACYYEEWFDDIEGGWVAAVNFQNHVLEEMSQIGIEQYFYWGGELNELAWRTYKPQYLKQKVETVFNRLIGI
ncbi:MAG: hypothetical protein CMP67_02105 [Flavobacteriales bacterium]|nr:hypothetical protein [Flavobacteriales bacterium]|tara:strand:+ start:336 stop:905 length:570 start_codon:yes stop_codon:yes gene_type:complete